MKIGIITGSVRARRKGGSVGQWVWDTARERQGDVEYVHTDLRDVQLPVMDGAVPPMGANKQYENENVQAWSQFVDSCDGFVFVTAEYNRSVPGAFKNAVDSLGPEWLGKPVAFVGYGSRGGVRAIEHWRQITATFSMYHARPDVFISTFEDFDGDDYVPQERHAQQLNAALDDLEQLAALRRA